MSALSTILFLSLIADSLIILPPLSLSLSIPLSLSLCQVKQGAFSREITMMWTSFFFGMSLVGLLGYFCISRTIYHNCNRVPGNRSCQLFSSMYAYASYLVTFYFLIFYFVSSLDSRTHGLTVHSLITHPRGCDTDICKRR